MSFRYPVKYQVKAYKTINGKKVIIAVSKVIHSITTDAVYANPTQLTTNIQAVTLSIGKSKRVVCQVVLPTGKKIIYHTAAVRYDTTNNKV